MTPRTEQEAFQLLAAMCAQAEHCQHEMAEKMQRWQLEEAAQERIMQRLVAERYVDDARYARALANDKIRYNKWGRRKVEQALWAKHIADDIRQEVMDEIPDTLYVSILQPLLRQKERTTRAANDYELRQKLVRFALGRGFTFDIIRQCIDAADELDDGLAE